MPVSNDRQRNVLHELERRLEHDDPAWVRQFSTLTPPREKGGTNTAMELSIAISVVLMALGLAFDSSQVVVTYCCAAVILAFVRLTQ
jgi:hypothetical protein